VATLLAPRAHRSSGGGRWCPAPVARLSAATPAANGAVPARPHRPV